MAVRCLRAFAAVLTSSVAALLAWSAVAQDRPKIVAQNYPLAYFAERLAGDSAAVAIPSPADEDPADWTPGVEDISRIQAADLILLNGQSYADWTSKASLPRARLLDTTAGFRDALIAEDASVHRHGPEGEHSHSGLTLHTWLDLDLAGQQAHAVAESLKRRAGVDAAVVDAALADLMTDLRALDEEARTAATALQSVTLIASHPIYQYFARAYGVEIANLHWEYNEPVSPEQWTELDEFLTSHPKTLFLWEGPPTEAAEQGLMKRGVVATLFDPAYILRDGDFLSTMQANLDRLSDAATRVSSP